VHLESEGESVEAVENLTHAVTLRPEYAEAHVLLGRVLARQGRTEEAKGHYRSALRSKPDLSDAHTRLAACLADEGRDQESLQHYLEAIRLNPGDLEAHNNVAWLLATDSNDGVRDGRKALEHARIAVALSHGEVPTVLGTLAAAYAENGRFAEAVESAKKALAMAQAASDAAAINDLRVQLRAYERGRAYRPPPHPPNR
jgi:tetratricopeptide (TPR) repeat protein